jgi:N4-gp56 family major capsid protein
MTTLFMILIAIVAMVSFAEVTSAAASSSGYTPIPEAVRAFYSKEVLFQAQPVCRFLQFAKLKNDLTAIRGKSISFTKYGNLSGGGAIAEDATLVSNNMVTSEVTITVTEQINAITLTELAVRTALVDVMGDASKLLGNNLATVLDGQFRDVCLATTNIIFGNGVADADAMTATSVFNSKTVKDSVELLATNNAPKFNGEYYVCIAHPKALRQLRDDSAWINAVTYMGRRQLYIGEAGMYEGVVFIETTNMSLLNPAQVDTAYGSTYTGGTGACEAVMFGENSYAWAVALDVELRDDGVLELGRKRTIGWYGIWGTGILEEQNIVKILTTATL